MVEHDNRAVVMCICARKTCCRILFVCTRLGRTGKYCVDRCATKKVLIAELIYGESENLNTLI